MSKITEIQWADHTFNPWIGCTKVNDDCLNCYAEAMDRQRFSKTLDGGTVDNPVRHWGKGVKRYRTSQASWEQVRRWDKKAEGRSENEERPRVFPSLCDWLDEDLPIGWLVDFLHLIWATPELDWLLLTKRPNSFFKRLLQARDAAVGVAWGSFINWLDQWLSGKEPPHNVWILASAGNQKNLDAMLPALLQIPAVVRGLSIEPMTGPVDLKLEVRRENAESKIHWVIFGGESHQVRKLARHCDVRWIRWGIKQCQIAGVPCFVKQLGTRPLWLWPEEMGEAERIKHPKGGDWDEWPEDLRVRQFPSQRQKAEGRSENAES